MLPSALSSQISQGLVDFLRFSFWSSTPGMEHAIDDLIASPGAIMKGPWISLQLPFIKGENPDTFPRVPLGYPPYAHQETAFERLSGRRKRSTLIATGTGSGKTESFLLPILDHCLKERAPGIKAILVYPMNALATDQAHRIASRIHANPHLRGVVRAGLYIGEDRARRHGGRDSGPIGPNPILVDRDAMQQDPPDILLTNYRMLDYLLVRPEDQRIWRHNERGTLRFLVVDELHTFDGAQGTDLACLIRRLKRRLHADDGSLCCVGTSATLGSGDAVDTLREYAHNVFGEPFDEDAVVGERRQNTATFLGSQPARFSDTPGPEHRDAMDPSLHTDPDAWLHAQVQLWFGRSLEESPDDPRTTLGEWLRAHTTFRALLRAIDAQVRSVEDVLGELGRARSSWRDNPELGRLALTSLLGLVAHARRPREELPAVRAAREERGEPTPLERLVDLRVQLWQRELARMVASVEPRPRIRHSDDLPRDERRQHLPMVHCRECGAMGWAARKDRDRPHVLRTELQALYRDFFAGRDTVRFLYPAAARPDDDRAWRHCTPQTVDLRQMTLLREGETADGPTMDVVESPNLRSGSEGRKLSRDCAFCGATDSLALLGFRAATLTSVTIDQLFASRFNEDRKLLAFSDSVQDAAHRAGFFGARTWRTTLRVALRQFLSSPDAPRTLRAVGRALGPYWRERMAQDEWVSTFLAPNMAWLHDWEALQRTGRLPEGSDLESLIDRRLHFEVQVEFGMNAGIGRSLVRTQSAAVGVDLNRVDNAVSALIEPVRNEVPGLRDVTPDALERFVLGWLTRLRQRGGILSSTLPPLYVESAGENIWAFSDSRYLPGFTPTSRVPVLLVDRPGRGRFESWRSGRGSAAPGWIARWILKTLGADRALTADAESLMPVVLPGLVRAGLLREQEGRNGVRVWGLDDDALVVRTEGVALRCTSGGPGLYVPEEEAPLWEGMPSLMEGASGLMERDDRPRPEWFGRLYATGSLARIFAEEHTGLLGRERREQVEREFKALAPGPGVPKDEARRPWYPNLLSCTPTLEMGIDIGDLGTALLCSVPPRQASYLQRIGRAGRLDGNALVVSVANARPHDLYFYARPEEMMAGQVDPPGVFLDAAAVLERQLTAFCLDRWVVHAGDEAGLPATLKEVFGRLQDEGTGHFPANLTSFVEAREPELLREFEEMFAGAISAGTREHLGRFLRGAGEEQASLRWILTDVLMRERRMRDGHRLRLRRVKERLREHGAVVARAEDHGAVEEALETEAEALTALIRSVEGRRTLEFLTDEGLLPNYAFPESAVRLNSVIWRRRKAPGKDGRKYESWGYEYARSPSSALSELAPQADFHAGGRQVRIDQVDVSVSPMEEWRFCPDCNHAQRVDGREEPGSCPSCGSASWKEESQRLKLMRLRQVFARAPDRKSRIRDDRDERRPRFFQRQMLVDFAEQDRGGAWVLGESRVPFGFEYLKRAMFREVNFGEPSDSGEKTTVAGRSSVRPGFQLCMKCGQVQDARKEEAQHTLSCPSRRAGAPQEIEPCLYLYREFGSEALRMLLPTDVASQADLHSFVAALQMGLQTRFGGSVDHLRTTVYSDPVPDSTLRKQYLVLYDTVPGGTGYLKQLVTPAEDGAEMPIVEVLRLAVERLEGCRCWHTEDDGCYRCLYAFRNATDMADTSARRASTLMRAILDSADKLEPIDTLGSVQVSGLQDSLLEVRFLEALRMAESGGVRATLEPRMVRGTPGHHWALGDAVWAVQAQVKVGPVEGVPAPMEIDFVLRPASAQSGRRPIAVFLDGWRYHRDRVALDLWQRQVLQATGRWDVWTLTWQDLDEVLHPGATPAVEPGDAVLRTTAGERDARWKGLLQGPLFDALVAELTGPGQNWEMLGNELIAACMRRGQCDVKAWQALVKEAAPAGLAPMLAAVQPLLTCTGPGSAGHVRWMAARDAAKLHVVAELNTRVGEVDDGLLEREWRAFLRMQVLLRAVPGAWFTSAGPGAPAGDFARVAELRGAEDDAPDERAEAWDDVSPGWTPLVERLIAAGVPAPEVGLDVPDDRGDALCEGELVWEEECIAVVLGQDLASARREPAEGWTVFTQETLEESVAPLLRALGMKETADGT